MIVRLEDNSDPLVSPPAVNRSRKPRKTRLRRKNNSSVVDRVPNQNIIHCVQRSALSRQPQKVKLKRTSSLADSIKISPVEQLME